MRTFPENSYDDDVIGRGNSVDLIAEIKRRRSKTVEIKMLRGEKNGFEAGTFGQFQFAIGDSVTMSVRFMGNGEGGGVDSEGLSTSQIDPDTPLEWVIHREEI